MALSPVRPRASVSVGSADTIAFTRSNSPALIASMNASGLAVASAMGRLYLAPDTTHVRLCGLRGLCVLCPRLAVLALAAWLWPAPVQSQTVMTMEPPVLGNTLPVEALSDLPGGANLFTLLDTAIPQVITERVDTG